MPSANWKRAQELYAAAIGRPAGERTALLDKACAGDAALRAEVDSLLASAKQPGQADDRHAPTLETMAAQVPRANTGPKSIGAYDLLQKVGEGGLGEVWLAEQRVPVRRRVALKLIKAGMDTRDVVARFESERQVLALMDHPAIAKVFDGGATAEGRPFFVMEYVPGISIAAYCDKHKLGLIERLELFMRVCEGVQHAHQKAVIHRDLKPSNILVAEVDGKPAPKIIDFGVAKATGQRFNAEAFLTRVGTVIGTPEYMSPEQADSAGEDIDTRTDVYSLGVVLYELLVGALPLDFGKVSFDEMLRKLREEDAARPSTRLRTLGGRSAVAAHNRHSDLPALGRHLKGDLDAIALKALEKERARRYATPMEMAADIGRYLRHEPVIARPASTAYRARKYVRRHRLGVAVAAGLILLLMAFGVAQTLQLRRTVQERDRANRERDRANRITQFMTKMFKVSDPSEARGDSVTAREILDKASQEIDTGLAKDPEVRAQMMHEMGTVYHNLGLLPQAQALMSRTVAIQRSVLGPQHLDTLTSMARLAGIWAEQGRYPEAEKLIGETLDTDRRVLGPEHPETLAAMTTLGVLLSSEGRHSEAEKVDREALQARRRVLGPEHADTLDTMMNLAVDYGNLGRYADAEKLLRETLDIELRLSGRENPATLATRYNLVYALDYEGRYAEAETLLRETLDTQRRVYGPAHPLTFRYMDMLAVLLAREGRYSEAVETCKQTLEARRRALGPGHPDNAGSTYTLGVIASIKGNQDDALRLIREAVDQGLSPEQASVLDSDPDLRALYSDPRFAGLVAHAKERVAVAGKPH